MKVINKWNNGLYEVQEEKDNSVVLKRCSDSKVFEISKSEFSFSYREIKK